MSDKIKAASFVNAVDCNPNLNKFLFDIKGSLMMRKNSSFNMFCPTFNVSKPVHASCKFNVKLETECSFFFFFLMVCKMEKFE